MRLEVTAHVTHDVFNHPTDQELLMANAVLSTALSNVTATVSGLQSTIDSQSTVIAAGDSTDVSTAVSTAVDAEDTAVAGEISSALSAG